MDAALRCSGCGLPVELDDDIVTVAGRRFHRMCVDAHHEAPAERASAWSGRLRGLVALGWFGRR